MHTARWNRATAIPLLIAAIGAPAVAQDDGASYLERATTHYSRVERELRAHPTPDLSPAQIAARDRILSALRAYRENADFGINTEFPGTRKPYFIDGGGRRCAVAWLLDATDRPELTLAVAAACNHVWVPELEGDPRLATWLEANGLTLPEATRIQLPSSRGGRGGPSGAPPSPPPPGTVDPGAIAASTDRWRPGDAGRPAGASSPSTPGAARTPSAARTPAPRSAPKAAPGGPTTGGIPLTDLLADERWVAWWDWNRAAFLDEAAASKEPRTARLIGPTTHSGCDSIRPPEPFGTNERIASRTRLSAALRDPDSNVRAAAAVALGRLGDDADVAALEGLLDDADRGVRNDAILALGANATNRAVRVLSQIALDGSLAGDHRAAVSDVARPLAVLALGVASRRGARTATGVFVRALAEHDRGEEGERMRTAALLHTDLVHGDALRVLARDTLEQPELDVAVRCCAVEALDFTAADSRRAILESLNGRELSLRRSAALTLGRTKSPLALPSLMTAFEMENEHFTRALILISIGEHGGADARTFLLEQMVKGPKSLRAFAAIGSGLCARDARDAVVCAAIRDAWKRENNHDHADAYLLAMGLARDADAVPLLMEVVHQSGSSLSRSIAAQALALAGGPAVRDTLRQQLAADSCPYARSIAAEVLGAIGDASDAERIVAALGNLRSPDERVRLANALGRLGGPPAYAALVRSLDGDELTARERAALLQALGQVLDPHPERCLSSLARAANYTVFPTWLRPALDVGL